MSDLQRALEIAVTAHRDQKRKNGMPYVLHPLRLMMKVDSIDEKIVAVLHDVVEDTTVTLNDLKQEGFSDEVLTGVACMTHETNVSYDDYLARLKQNPIARIVKRADIEDNLDILQIPNPTDRDFGRMAKYHKAWHYLGEFD